MEVYVITLENPNPFRSERPGCYGVYSSMERAEIELTDICEGWGERIEDIEGDDLEMTVYSEYHIWHIERTVVDD